LGKSRLIFDPIVTEVAAAFNSLLDTPEPWTSESDFEWKKTGRTALAAFASIAVCAGAPAALARRRRPSYYTPIGGAAAAPVAVAAEEVMEPAQPAQQGVERAPRCSEEDAATIRRIYSTTANTGVVGLAWQKSDLDAWVTSLREHGVHPFEILRRTPKESMQKILREGNRLKLGGMFDGIRKDMERERATLDRYTDGLALDMDKSPEELRPLIQERDWRAVVCYLFDIDDARRA
jgi:hypothetical protein